ncbi:MAG: hypothetical protein M4579_001693 [Chaenotheca gracillima]|nr:MAG: hypothetical protein M4579_001693 [Chaenotheca gracillima]
MESKDDTPQKWWSSFWLGDHFDPDKKFTSLASQHRDGQRCVTGRCFFGSFHICVRVVFDDGVDWIVRLPIPTRLLDPDGHTEREVAILQYLRDNTAIPIPAVIAYGFNDTSSSELGPYIITKFAHGIPLTDWFKDRASKETRLKPHIEEEKIVKVYKQAASIILELTSIDFSAIGTLSLRKGKHRTWSIESSPWTTTLHEAERNHGIHPQATDGPFENSKEWVSYVANHHEQIIRGDHDNPRQNEDLESLRQFRELIPRFISSNPCQGHFKLHCDDFGAGNMLVDNNYNIVGLGDWEFTYAAPPEYQCCLASWLILSKPYDWSLEDYNIYSVQLKRFLEILEEEENQRSSMDLDLRGVRLSSVIRKGWEDGTFWFVLCTRSGIFFDDLWERFRKFDPVNFFLQSVEARKDVLGVDHPDTLSSMANLALTYCGQGRWKDAEELGLLVLETRKRVLGAEHPETLSSMATQASVFWNQGRCKEAEELAAQIMGREVAIQFR